MSLSTNLEIEFKNMLEKKEYEHLMSIFNNNNQPLIVQQNIYYDTPDAQLKTKKSALRIRVKHDTYELTLKIPQPIGLLEVNQPLTRKEVDDFNTYQHLPDGAVTQALVQHGVLITSLQMLTDLTTKRFECDYKGGLLVLDESYYHQITDYELEYEVTNHERGYQVFLDFLQTYHIQKRPAQSKIKRALQAKANEVKGIM